MAQDIWDVCNLKTVGVEDEFVEELSRCLHVHDGGFPMELLSELQELAYSQAGSGNPRDVFISFTNARQNTDQPLALIRL